MRKLRLVSLVYFVAVFGTSCVMLCSKAAVAPDVLIGKHKLAIQKTKWKKATSTWYGNPHGDGNDGKGKHSNFFKLIFICNMTVVLWKFKIYGRLIEKKWYLCFAL